MASVGPVSTIRPLRMTDTRYRPDSSLLPRIAPTEVDPWRQRHLRGEAHDENAFALGGVSAHAGLFSTGHDLARLARLCESSGIRPEIDRVLPLTEAREGFAAMAAGDVFGKIVFTP